MLACHQLRIKMYKYLHVTTFTVLSIVVWYVDYAFKVWWFVCIFFVAALLESVPSRAAESCQHVIQSGDSTGKGECWIDPQSNGNPFKAFCEMTTDEGNLVLFVFKCWFFSRLFMEAGFFCFLMQRRLDDIVKRCWKESSVQLRSFCDFYWSTTTCQLETFGKFISVEILLLAITL